MRQTFFLSVSLAVIWLTNSGHYNALLLFLGAISIAFVVWIARKMDLVDHESQPIHVTTTIPFYWAWLVKEIVLANIAVVKKIWFSPQTITPALAWIPLSQHSDFGRVTYANSITLTPGTVTLELTDTAVLVHALMSESIEELRLGEMERRVSELEK